MRDQRTQIIMNSLSEQIKTGKLCDVLFYHNSGSVWAHSCILEGFSPFFSQLFSNRSKSEHHWSIKQPLQISVSNITNCKSSSKNNCMQCVAQMVRYIYTGHIKPSLLHLQHLLILCDRLKIKELKEECKKYQRDHSLLNVPKKSDHEEIQNDPNCNNETVVISPPHDSKELPPNDLTCCSLEPSCDTTSQYICDSKCRPTPTPDDELAINSERESLIECKICSYVSTDHNLVEVHHKAFHSSMYKCVYCNFAHKNIAILVEHIVTCYSKEKLICSICLYKGKDSNDLISHTKMHLSPKPFNCTNCERAFERRSSWLKHSRSHVYMKSFVCSACPLKFNTNAERSKHFKILHAPKKYACNECGFLAPFPSVLDNHKLKHRNKLSCQEKECDFQTSSEIMLLRHKSVHKSRKVQKVDKSKECSVCSMKFTLTKNLARHMRTHKSQHDKIKCRFCDYETYRSDKYNEHVANKHDDRKHVSSNDVTSSSAKSRKTESVESPCAEQGPEDNSEFRGDKSIADKSSMKHVREGYNVESHFPPKHNTLMMNDEGDISIVNSNENNSVTLRNIGNLTGTITLDERTGVLTMNNINSGSVFLNETTGELTYINLDTDKNVDLNCFNNQESLKRIDNFNAAPISSSNRTSEVTKLDEFTGEIIKVSTSQEDNFIPEQEFESFDMDVNDESLDGFDEFDEMLFEVFNEEDDRLGGEVAVHNESTIGLNSPPMPHLDESTGLLTFDETMVPVQKSKEIWSGAYQPIKNRDMNDSEAYQLLLDEVTGVLHD